MSGVVFGIPLGAPLPRASAGPVLPDLYFLFRHNNLGSVLYKGSLAFFKSLNPSVNKPIVSNLAFLSVKARREHHPTGLFPTLRSDTYE